MRYAFALPVFLFLGLCVMAGEHRSVSHHKDCSVLINDGADGVGSGVIFKNGSTSFIWTDYHVVEGAKTKTGFKDVTLAQPEFENGRKVGLKEFFAHVFCVNQDEDIALLVVHKKDFGKASVKFFTGVPKDGAAIWHVGSMRGYQGINSVATGVVAAAGRLRRSFHHNELDGYIYDQISGVAHPGSSGGGVFLKKSGECIGLVTEFLSASDGYSHGSYCITPSRRLVDFAKRNKLDYAVDASVEPPGHASLLKTLRVEQP